MHMRPWKVGSHYPADVLNESTSGGERSPLRAASTLKTGTGRAKPLRVKSPIGSTTTRSSTAAWTRALIRIWQNEPLHTAVLPDSPPDHSAHIRSDLRNRAARASHGRRRCLLQSPACNRLFASPLTDGSSSRASRLPCEPRVVPDRHMALDR